MCFTNISETFMIKMIINGTDMEIDMAYGQQQCYKRPPLSGGTQKKITTHKGINSDKPGITRRLVFQDTII